MLGGLRRPADGCGGALDEIRRLRLPGASMTVWRLLGAHVLFVSFLLLFLEETGLPPLIPGDALMVLAGARAADGRESLFQVLAVLEVATVLGGSLLYWVSARWGPAATTWVERLVGTPPARLGQGSRWLERHGQR